MAPKDKSPDSASTSQAKKAEPTLEIKNGESHKNLPDKTIKGSKKVETPALEKKSKQYIPPIGF